MYWQKENCTDQCNRIENPDTDPHKYAKLFTDKGAKAIHGGKYSLSTNGAGGTRNPEATK